MNSIAAVIGVAQNNRITVELPQQHENKEEQYNNGPPGPPDSPPPQFQLAGPDRPPHQFPPPFSSHPHHKNKMVKHEHGKQFMIQRMEMGMGNNSTVSGRGYVYGVNNAPITNTFIYNYGSRYSPSLTLANNLTVQNWNLQSSHINVQEPARKKRKLSGNCIEAINVHRKDRKKKNDRKKSNAIILSDCTNGGAAEVPIVLTNKCRIVKLTQSTKKISNRLKAGQYRCTTDEVILTYVDARNKQICFVCHEKKKKYGRMKDIRQFHKRHCAKHYNVEFRTRTQQHEKDNFTIECAFCQLLFNTKNSLNRHQQQLVKYQKD